MTRLPRKMLLRTFEKALAELEACWERDAMGERIASGSIEIVLRDENGREAVCKPTFATRDPALNPLVASYLTMTPAEAALIEAAGVADREAPIARYPNRDATPLDSDWDDIRKLFADMKCFGKEHPDHVFIPADDPGINYTPPRVPRLGWVALSLESPLYDKSWTILLSKIHKTLGHTPEEEVIRESLKSAHSRRTFTESFNTPTQDVIESTEKSASTFNTSTIGPIVLNTVRFAVTPDDLVTSGVNRQAYTKTPDSGLIRKFEAALNGRLGEPVPKGFDVQGHDVKRPHMVVITFHKDDGSLWAQEHEMLIEAPELFLNKRWALIDRAFCFLRKEYRDAHDNAEPSLFDLVDVQVRFYTLQPVYVATHEHLRWQDHG